jgi:hypothetical protein
MGTDIAFEARPLEALLSDFFVFALTAGFLGAPFFRCEVITVTLAEDGVDVMAGVGGHGVETEGLG